MKKIIILLTIILLCGCLDPNLKKGKFVDFEKKVIINGKDIKNSYRIKIEGNLPFIYNWVEVTPKEFIDLGYKSYVEINR